MMKVFSLRAKLTVLVTACLAVALAMLTGALVHLQRQNFRVMAKESALSVVGELSSTLFHKWNPAAKPARNSAALAGYAAIKGFVQPDTIVYAAFQDAGGTLRYIAKSVPAYVWMLNLTRLDPYTARMLAVTGSASRTLGSYPEGEVTEFLGAVYGKDKSLLGTVRVGVSQRKVGTAMGRLAKTTLIKMLAANLLALALLAFVVFYLASGLERGISSIRVKARRVLESPAPAADPQNVLLELGREFEEIEQLVSALKGKFLELASTISHEFRSPLQAIDGYVDYLRKGCAGPVNPRQDKYLKIIGENSRRFEGFIDNVMDLVRVGGGNLQLSPAPFRANDVVGKAVELFSKQADENNIRLTLKGPETPVWVYGDQNRVFQILVNLFSNALKFTPPLGMIEAGFAERNGFAEFYVSDNGPGIPPERQEKLFTEFYQVPELEPLRGYKGLGIGLALCKKLAQAQGGGIKLESAPGKGTKVTVSLPRPK